MKREWLGELHFCDEIYERDIKHLLPRVKGVLSNFELKGIPVQGMAEASNSEQGYEAYLIILEKPGGGKEISLLEAKPVEDLQTSPDFIDMELSVIISLYLQSDGLTGEGK